MQKQKIDVFVKILENNVDEREIKFHVFDTFLGLTPVKSGSLKISLQNNRIHLINTFSLQHNIFN